MNESTFWQALKKDIGGRIYSWKINARFVAGVPDSWFSGMDTDLWCEMKYVQTMPPLINPTNLLSPRQMAWLEARYKEGRNTSVLIGSPEGCVMFWGDSWKEPLDREEFRMDCCWTRKNIANEIVRFCGAKQ